MPVIAGAPASWQYYFNPWWREEHAYVTSLTAAQCRSRLNRSTTRFLGRSVGRAMLSAADFTVHHITLFNNGFKPFGYVNFDEATTPPETIVHVTLSGAFSLQVFFVIWGAFMCLIGVATVVAAIGHAPASGDMSAFSVIPLLFIAPFALNTFGRSIAFGDRDYLTRFLVDELELRPAPPLPPPIG